MVTFRPFLARLFRIAARRPTGHPPFAFTDHKGRHYYGWEDFAQMPPARANEVDDVLLQIDAGLSHSQLTTLSAAITSALSDAIEAKEPKVRTRHIAKANAIAMELQSRPKQIVPRECYYALAAICAVRQDEDPDKFDPTIQGEKMQTFREAAEAGHAFFTHQAAFAKLLGVTHSSVAAFVRLSIGWMATEARIEAVKQM
jgi:hypothetical protein